MKKATLHMFSSSEEAEKFQLQHAAGRTYNERFYTLMKLIKLSAMIKGGKIISGNQ
ncbi:MAG: hypothetical protein WCF67_13950 [Chitinophagaceae bacterium]